MSVLERLTYDLAIHSCTIGILDRLAGRPFRVELEFDSDYILGYYGVDVQ